MSFSLKMSQKKCLSSCHVGAVVYIFGLKVIQSKGSVCKLCETKLWLSITEVNNIRFTQKPNC